MTYKSYEPLRDIEDGINKKTKQEYALFLKQSGEYSEGCSYPGDVWVIQNKGYRMFVLKTSKSCSLLNKGQRVGSLNHPLDYYYDNLPKYARTAERCIDKYLPARKEIARLVKCAGGKGYEHGCIVDYNPLAHLFFNPNDGTLHCYTASSIVSKHYFQDFSSMLSAYGLQSTAIEGRAAERLDGLCVAGGHHDCEYYEGTEQYALSDLITRLERVATKKLVTAWSDELLEGSFGSFLAKTDSLRMREGVDVREENEADFVQPQRALPGN